MKIFLITLGIATLLILLCALGLGIGKLVTGRNILSCKRCGHPEKKDGCSICKNPNAKK